MQSSHKVASVRYVQSLRKIDSIIVQCIHVMKQELGINDNTVSDNTLCVVLVLYSNGQHLDLFAIVKPDLRSYWRKIAYEVHEKIRH